MATLTVTSDAATLTDPTRPEALTFLGAVSQAQSTPDADTIVFADGITTISLSQTVQISGAGGPLTINGDQNGDRLPDVTLDAGGTLRHINLTSDAEVALQGLTLTGGYSAPGGATGADAVSAIFNSGTLSLTDVILTGNTAIGATGTRGSDGADRSKPGKAAANRPGTDGSDGGDGGSGGTGGEAATIWNSGTLDLENVQFTGNLARPGNGGRGGDGGNGAQGGEGGDFKFPFDPGRGGDGGDGGDGGSQGAHGRGAYGVLSAGPSATVTGEALIDEAQRSYGRDTNLANTSGGSGGAKGLGGYNAFKAGRWFSGDAGSNGSGRTTDRGNLLSDPFYGLGSTAAPDRIDAYFTLFTGDTVADEGDTVTFTIIRHGTDLGVHDVAWELVLDGVILKAKDFVGATSGEAKFDETTGNAVNASVTLARDNQLSPEREVYIRLTDATDRNAGAGSDDVLLTSSDRDSFTIASEQGSPGDDALRGTNSGDNYLLSSGNDTARGRDGDDTIKGGTGDDTLFGGADEDRVQGGGGNDDVFGGAGNDTVTGGRGADLVRGDGGQDLLIGGPGDDTLKGGSGADTFQFGQKDGRDIVKDYRDGTDLIAITGGLTFEDLTLKQSGRTTKITAGDTEILLRNTKIDTLTEDDFLF